MYVDLRATWHGEAGARPLPPQRAGPKAAAVQNPGAAPADLKPGLAARGCCTWSYGHTVPLSRPCRHSVGSLSRCPFSFPYGSPLLSGPATHTKDDLPKIAMGMEKNSLYMRPM